MTIAPRIPLRTNASSDYAAGKGSLRTAIFRVLKFDFAANTAMRDLDARLSGSEAVHHLDALENALLEDAAALVVWGSQQGITYSLFYLLGLASATDFAMVPSYFPLTQSLSSIVAQIQVRMWRSIVLVIPDAHVAAACRCAANLWRRHRVSVRLVSHADETSCNATPWRDFSRAASGQARRGAAASSRARDGRQFIVRRNASGMVELTVWQHTVLNQHARRRVASLLGYRVLPTLHVTPISSADSIVLHAGNLLCGFPICSQQHGFASLSQGDRAALSRGGGFDLMANPAQWRWVEEDDRLRRATRALLASGAISVGSHAREQPTLRSVHACFAGGGAVTSKLMARLRRLGCANPLAIWGASEVGTVGRSNDGLTYALLSSVQEWKVVPFGPYGGGGNGGSGQLPVSGQPPSVVGELWLRTDATARHADPSADWRYTPDGFFRTRNIVRVVDAGSGASSGSSGGSDQGRSGSSGGSSGGGGSRSSSGGGGSSSGGGGSSKSQTAGAPGLRATSSPLRSVLSAWSRAQVPQRTKTHYIMDRYGRPSLLSVAEQRPQRPSPRQQPPRVMQLDKTTRVFRLPSNAWVATGALERQIEAKRAVSLAAVLLDRQASSYDSSVAVVVWPSDEGRALEEAALRREVVAALAQPAAIDFGGGSGALVKLGRMVRADEAWESRPRAKFQAVLSSYFLGEGGQAAASRVVAAVLHEQAQHMRVEMSAVLRENAVPQAAAAFAIDSILACSSGACLVRSADGTVREPERSLEPYSPHVPLPARLARFDSEPWQLYDLHSSMSAASERPSADDVLHAIRVLHARRERLGEVLPAVSPSLGLLQMLGSRVLLRLHCANSIAVQAPTLLAEGWASAGSRAVHERVLRVCRAEWFADTST